jgi:hypothetical protein
MQVLNSLAVALRDLHLRSRQGDMRAMATVVTQEMMMMMTGQGVWVRTMTAGWTLR